VLLEARDRLGGTIETERADGFLLEAGPDSFISEKPWALDLCMRIGIGDRLLRTDDRHRRVYVWFGGRLHPLPDGFQLLAPTRLGPFVGSGLFSWPGKLRMSLEVALPRGGGFRPRALDPDESLGSFVRRRLGAEALERVAQPLVAGIYTADPDELSLAATMPRFLEMERRHRSVILSLWRAARRLPRPAASGARWSLFMTLKDGMGELVEALGARLPAGAVRLERRVTGIERAGDGWRLATAAGEAMIADRVILATEAGVASRLLRYVDPAVSALLADIPYASSATVSVGYRRADIPHPLDGFGFVVPRVEGRGILACTFASVKYPGRAPEGMVLLRCFLGGALDERVLEKGDDDLLAVARSELGEALGVRAEPVLARVRRWPFAMPQYRVGHLDRVAAIGRVMEGVPGLGLAGGGYRGVGIPDCVRSGEVAAARALGLDA
jgi:oxygen-dependent protoporphyrinogen oxidase